MEIEYSLDGNNATSGTVQEDFRNMQWDKFLEKYPHMAICDAVGTPILMGKEYKEKPINAKMIGQVRIGRVVVESHPHYAYWLELEHTFEKGDIITTCMTDPAPDREIFVVNDIIDRHTVCLNRPIALPAGKHLRKLTTVDELMSKVEGADKLMAERLHEQEIREQMHQLFINNPLKGKIEDYIIEGYLYTISHEDMTLTPEDRKLHPARPGIRNVIVQTGKAGIMTFVETCRKGGLPDTEIAKSIWIEMVVHGVRMCVNIANLKINIKDKKEEDMPREEPRYEDHSDWSDEQHRRKQQDKTKHSETHSTEEGTRRTQMDSPQEEDRSWYNNNDIQDSSQDDSPGSDS